VQASRAIETLANLATIRRILSHRHVGGRLRQAACATVREYDSWLRSQPRCGFEIAVNGAPYAGVRGRGIAQCAPASDDRILHALIDRFLGDENPKLAILLLSRTETEVTVSVTPQWLTSWDYGDRIS
jgi:hypothetical protein